MLHSWHTHAIETTRLRIQHPYVLVHHPQQLQRGQAAFVRITHLTHSLAHNSKRRTPPRQSAHAASPAVNQPLRARHPRAQWSAGAGQQGLEQLARHALLLLMLLLLLCV